MDNILQNLSPLQHSQVNQRRSNFKRHKKSLAAKVMLTSLIDAFSILVIYLLVNFSSTGEILYLSKGMELPAAVTTELLERNTVVKIEKNKIFIEDKEVKVSQLAKMLLEIKKENPVKAIANPDTPPSHSLTIQADRREEFKLLSPVIAAGGIAGFSDIHFAVLQE